jgi:hypothetical protein
MEASMSGNLNDKITKIIEEVKIKPWAVSQKREEIVARLRSLSGDIDRKIITEIRSFRPLGTMSELGAAMGGEPNKGVRIDTLMGATIFDEKRVPSKERIARWDAEHKEAERIHELIPEYAFGIEARPNTVTGNFRVVEHARRLKNQGLLSQEEELTLNSLEKYWQEHPELDREKGYGIWGHNLDIIVPERHKEKIGGAGMAGQFKYYLRNRPPDIGTYPKGAVMKEAWLPRKVTPKGNMAFGWVSYDRELTPDEIKNYELFVDETVMPKLVAELIKFTHDEGINEGYKELKSEYGKALIGWLKANNEWKPDKGEQAEFLRHLARMTGIGVKTPETKTEDQEKAKLFLSAIQRFTLDELIQQEGTVRRWSIRFPQMEKELEDEYKMYLELRRAEKASAEADRKYKASRPQSENAKHLYQQMRMTNSVRELDDWRNKVLFEAHLPDVEEDILMRELAAQWRVYLETRGVPAKEMFTKFGADLTDDFYYFGTEVWIHPVTLIFGDNPTQGIIHDAKNGGELFEVARKGHETEGTFRVQLDRIYVTKLIEKPEVRYQAPIKAVTTIERPVFNPKQAIKIAADSIDQLRRVDVFRVLNTYSNKSKELGDYIKSKRPDLVDEVNKVLGITPTSTPAPLYIQLESTEALYKRYTSGYSTVSFLGIVGQDTKDLAHSIGYELKLDTTIYTPSVLLRYAEQFKELAQRDYEKEHQKQLARKEKEEAEKEKERREGGQAFWDEVKDLKVVDFEVQHDINPDKPTRTYYHVYDRTYAILENGKKVQISYEINKGEEGKRAAKATKDFYRKFYDRHIGKPLSDWINGYNESFIDTNMKSYMSQKPKPRFTFIPEEQHPVVKKEVPEPTRYFTLKKAHALITENYLKLSDDKLHEKRIQLQDYIRLIELPTEYSRKTLIQGGYYAKVTDPYATGMAPVDAFLYTNLKWVLGEADKETQRRKQEKEKVLVFERPQPIVTKTPLPQDIKQQFTLKFQLAKSLDELQTIKNEIPFLSIPQADKIQLIDVFSKRYASFAREIPFGTRIPPKLQEKPRILGAQTPQQRFEEEQRRKAAAEKRTRGQQKLSSSAGSSRLSEFGIGESRRGYY